MDVTLHGFLQDIACSDTKRQQSWIGNLHTVGVELYENVATGCIWAVDKSVAKQLAHHFFIVCGNVFAP